MRVWCDVCGILGCVCYMCLYVCSVCLWYMWCVCVCVQCVWLVFVVCVSTCVCCVHVCVMHGHANGLVTWSQPTEGAVTLSHPLFGWMRCWNLEESGACSECPPFLRHLHRQGGDGTGQRDACLARVRPPGSAQEVSPGPGSLRKHDWMQRGLSSNPTHSAAAPVPGLLGLTGPGLLRVLGEAALWV